MNGAPGLLLRGRGKFIAPWPATMARREANTERIMWRSAVSGVLQPQRLTAACCSGVLLHCCTTLTPTAVTLTAALTAAALTLAAAALTAALAATLTTTTVAAAVAPARPAIWLVADRCGEYV